MVGNYEIKQGDRVIGHVQVEKEGLYYRIRCRCDLSGEVIHRLTVRCGGREENLGVCVPVDGRFGVDKKIPCKRLGDGVPEFCLVPKHGSLAGKFIAVYPEEPFAYIHRLEQAFLAYHEGQIGILMKE